jgi:hypothetical protein
LVYPAPAESFEAKGLQGQPAVPAFPSISFGNVKNELSEKFSRRKGGRVRQRTKAQAQAVVTTPPNQSATTVASKAIKFHN